MTLEKRFVAKVDFSIDFAYSSANLGYKKEQLATQDTFLNERLIDTVVRLSQFIGKRQYVEIYTEKGYGGWGRLKASDSLREDGRERAGLGFYAGFFHGRAKAGKDDPLVVFSFRDEIIPPPTGYQSAYQQAVIHAVSDHKHLFAEGDDKYDSQLMRDLRHKNSGILNISAPTEMADDTSEEDV